jgi:hypothetical protein
MNYSSWNYHFGSATSFPSGQKFILSTLFWKTLYPYFPCRCVMPPSSGSSAWWWRKNTPLKRRSASMRVHGAVSKKAVIAKLPTVRTWNVIYVFPSDWGIKFHTHIKQQPIAEDLSFVLRWQKGHEKSKVSDGVGTKDILIFSKRKLFSVWTFSISLFSNNNI